MKQVSRGRSARHVATVLITLLPVAHWPDSAGAEEPKGFEFDLALQVVGADLGDLGSAAPLSFDVGGLPVSLGAESGGDTGNPGLRAGFNGTYALPIGAGFSVVASGNLEKTRYLEDSFLGSDRLTGSTSLRFQDGNFNTVLEPGVGFDLLAGTVATRHLVLDARASRAITDTLVMSIESGWARREHPGLDQAGADLGHGRIVLDFKLGKAQLGLAYETTQEWSDLTRESRARSGPALDFDLALLKGFDLGMSYQYCEDTDVDDNLRKAVETSHAFGLTALWQNPEEEYLTFSGGYTLDRTDPSGTGPATTSHDGIINMALKF